MGSEKPPLREWTTSILWKEKSLDAAFQYIRKHYERTNLSKVWSWVFSTALSCTLKYVLLLFFTVKNVFLWFNPILPSAITLLQHSFHYPNACPTYSDRTDSDCTETNSPSVEASHLDEMPGPTYNSANFRRAKRRPQRKFYLLPDPPSRWNRMFRHKLDRLAGILWWAHPPLRSLLPSSNPGAAITIMRNALDTHNRIYARKLCCGYVSALRNLLVALARVWKMIK